MSAHPTRAALRVDREVAHSRKKAATFAVVSLIAAVITLAQDRSVAWDVVAIIFIVADDVLLYKIFTDQRKESRR